MAVVIPFIFRRLVLGQDDDGDVLRKKIPSCQQSTFYHPPPKKKNRAHHVGESLNSLSLKAGINPKLLNGLQMTKINQ